LYLDSPWSGLGSIFEVVPGIDWRCAGNGGIGGANDMRSLLVSFAGSARHVRASYCIHSFATHSAHSPNPPANDLVPNGTRIFAVVDNGHQARRRCDADALKQAFESLSPTVSSRNLQITPTLTRADDWTHDTVIKGADVAGLN
jgi:hypothetical protein